MYVTEWRNWECPLREILRIRGQAFWYGEVAF
jgi:hypothetical protein